MIFFLKKGRINRYSAASGLVIFLVFFLSLLLAPYYNEGDQITYTMVYDLVSDLSLIDGFIAYSGTLGGTTEFIHYLVISITSGWGVEKNTVMACANTILAFILMRLFREWKVYLWTAVAIVLTNYYLIGMYFAAERLKFGFIFLSMSMLFVNRKIPFYASALLAVGSHVQTLIMYGSLLFAEKSKALILQLKTFKTNYKSIGFWLLGTILLLIGSAIVGGYVFGKVASYYALNINQTALQFVRTALFLILSLSYSKTKLITTLQFVPLFLAVFIVGAERVNMLSYILFLYYGLKFNGGVNFGVIATSMYFALKSVSFVVEFINTGQGFGEFTTFPGNILF